MVTAPPHVWTVSMQRGTSLSATRSGDTFAGRCPPCPSLRHPASQYEGVNQTEPKQTIHQIIVPIPHLISHKLGTATASQYLREEKEENRIFKGYSFHPRVGNGAQEIKGISHVSTANYGHVCSRGSCIFILLFISEEKPFWQLKQHIIAAIAITAHFLETVKKNKQKQFFLFRMAQVEINWMYVLKIHLQASSHDPGMYQTSRPPYRATRGTLTALA